MSNLRILWMSNAPWVGTGYGVQASHIIPFLKERPEVEEVSLFAFYGIQGAITRQMVGKHWIDCYPPGVSPYGEDLVKHWMDRSQSNVLISLLDVFVVPPDFGSQGFYWCPYAPIDHDPLPPVFVDRFRSSYRPIVYSKFAVKEMKRLGLECWYAPHGVETKIFKPRPKRKRQDRTWAGLEEGTFVVGMVAANKDNTDRKGFHEAFMAFRNLLDKHPTCQLYIHALVTPEMGGLHLIELAKTYGIIDNCRFTLREHIFGGLLREDLARIYNCFDVFLNPCHRAGFEIPLIEAQASGVPIIAGDWHSMPELRGYGWLIKPAQKQASPLGSFLYIPSVDSITDSLLSAYENAGDERGRRIARDFAMEYEWKTILSKYWGPIISSLDQEISVKTQKPIPESEIRMLIKAKPFEGEVKEVGADGVCV